MHYDLGRTWNGAERRSLRLKEAVDEWERRFGVLTDEELAEGRALLQRADGDRWGERPA